MYKVVIDTNLLIDAFSDDYNYANRIIDEVIAGNITAFANKATVNENRLLTSNKISDEGFQKKLKFYFDKLNRPGQIKPLEVVTEDPEDNKLVESAVASDADFLITSDNHLLKLGKYKGIKIVSPTQFWNIYEDQSNDGWMKWLKDFIK